ncbi:MAG: hypothetical protein ABIJ09_27055, partial [Pseudomonadota bacterium]
AQPAQPAKAADPAKPAAAPAAAPAEPAAAATCHCDQHMEMMKQMRDMHQGALDMMKNDPVAKNKEFKGPAKKAYMDKAKANKTYHQAMVKAINAQLKFMEKAHKGKDKPCELMAGAPDDVKKVLAERKKMQAAKMKDMATKMAAMADVMAAD